MNSFFSSCLIYCIIKDNPNASLRALRQAHTGQKRFLHGFALYNFFFSNVLSATNDKNVLHSLLTESQIKKTPFEHSKDVSSYLFSFLSLIFTSLHYLSCDVYQRVTKHLNQRTMCRIMFYSHHLDLYQAIHCL